MTHYIIAKFKPEYNRQKREMYSAILELFEHTKELPGVSDVLMRTNCTDLPNRYDIMIMIKMDREALPLYNECIWHKQWKADYGDFLQSKAIFDCEE